MMRVANFDMGEAMANTLEPIADGPYVIQEDGVQSLLANFASEMSFECLSPEAIHAAKLRIIDTIGALVGGYFGEACQMARRLVSMTPQKDGSTVLGSTIMTTPDLAAFVNGTTARYVELNDTYHHAGSSGGHTSDALMPLLAVAEQRHSSGRDFIASAVVAYEAYLRISDAKKIRGWDCSTLTCLAVALGSAKLMELDVEQLKQAISMAVIPNNALGQTRLGDLSMWKAVAAGQAGRSGVFAALLAREGMQGAHLPFEGQDGWFNYVAQDRLHLEEFGGKVKPFKIEETVIKIRPACSRTISSILAAEKVYEQIENSGEIAEIKIEVYAYAKNAMSPAAWNPTNRETADHSIPYVVGCALQDGTVTPRQFDDAHLSNQEIRKLMARMVIVENSDFTKAYEKEPVMHWTRITVVKKSGETVVGETGGAGNDLGTPRSDDYVNEKFIALTQEYFGMKRVNHILERLWSLEDVTDVAGIPALLAM